MNHSALLVSKHELAQKQPQAESNAQPRGNKLQDIRDVERLNARIAHAVKERGNPKHQHQQTDNDPGFSPMHEPPFVAKHGSSERTG